MIVASEAPATIVIATDSTAPSGVGEHMLSLAAALRGSHCVFVGFSAEGTGAAFLKRASDIGIPVKAIDGDGAALSRWLTEISADLLHVHAGVAWEGHGLTRAGAAAGVAVVRTEHLPYVLTDAAQKQEHLLSLGLLDHTIFVSDATGGSFRRAQAAAGRSTTIRNGVARPRPARDRRRTRIDLGIPESHFVILTVARFTPQKAYPLLIRAMRQVLGGATGLRLLLVGEGPERQASEDLARELGITEWVDFLGERPDVADLLTAADLFVLASLFEGLPLVVLEAMALGLPVVASRIGGTCEALGADYPWLVEAGEEDALARTIAGALADPALRRRLGERNRLRFEAQFTADRMVAETAALYRSVISERAMRS